MAQPVNGYHQGTWTEGVWAKKRLEESRDSLIHDTITEDELVEPMIDQCGHTYSRHTWQGLSRLINPVTLQANPNAVRCPVSRAIVQLDTLRPNLHAQDTVRYLTEERRASSASSSSSSSCSSSMSSTTAPTIGTTAPVATADPVMALILTQLTSLNTKIDKLTDKVDLQHRQITNLLEMSYCDRAWSLIKCNHVKSVSQRGFTADELRRLNTPINTGT